MKDFHVASAKQEQKKQNTKAKHLSPDSQSMAGLQQERQYMRSSRLCRALELTLNEVLTRTAY